MPERIGKSVIKLQNEVNIISASSIVGKKEGEGPLKDKFDECLTDMKLNKDTWEQSESEMQKKAISICMQKADLKEKDIDFLFAGDLLSQCSASCFGARSYNIPFVGLYGACSTMAEALALSALSVETGISKRSMAVTSSHFCSAEKQFRTPLEYGGQRPPTSQWTATASGCTIVGKNDKSKVKVSMVSFGKVCDMGITDANNMGAAMAPAACETICSFLKDTKTKPDDYSMILTGDLGKIGSDILKRLCTEQYGIDIRNCHNDCGLMLFNLDEQDVNSGASGCGCSACVLCADIFKRIESGELSKVLFVGTGALLSNVSPLQGETIPAIAHAVLLERR